MQDVGETHGRRPKGRGHGNLCLDSFGDSKTKILPWVVIPSTSVSRSLRQSSGYAENICAYMSTAKGGASGSSQIMGTLGASRGSQPETPQPGTVGDQYSYHDVMLKILYLNCF